MQLREIRGTGGPEEVPGSEALKSTAYWRLLPTPLHQHPSSYLSEGLIGSNDRPEAVEQQQPLVQRVDVAQRDAEDHHQTRPPAILREQQRSSCRICVEAARRTSYRLGKVASRVAVAGNHPRTARRAAQDGPPRRRWRRGSSCAHPASPTFHPLSTALRRRRGRATLLLGLIATSETFSAPLQGQEGQRCGGAPSSGTAGRLTGGESLSPYFGYCQDHATHL